MKIRFLFVLLPLLTICSGSFATVQESGDSTTPTYHRGETVIESTMMPSPEASSRVKYADVPFTHSQGLAEYEIDFSTLKGRELSLPIRLSYRSGGIKLDETAGIAGLGWSLEAGGCITRTVMDMPDEMDELMMRHQMPSGALLDSLESNYHNVGSGNYAIKVAMHLIDAQLDRYNYSFCGLSGSFVIQGNSVTHLSGDGVKISFQRDSTGAPGVFTLAGPDGTVYTFAAKEVGHHAGWVDEAHPMPSGKEDVWDAYTSWYLTKITSRSGLETATLQYGSAGKWEQDILPDSWTYTTTVHSSTPVESIYQRVIPDTHTIKHSYDVLKLSSISLGEFSVHFHYATGTGCDNHLSEIHNHPVRLTGITLSHSEEGQLDSLVVGTLRHSKDGRIILNSLRRYRCGVLDDRWDFSYYERPGIIKVCQGSQDWFGYYNSAFEPEFVMIGDPIPRSTNKCPYYLNESLSIVPRSESQPVEKWASYLSLKSVDHDGAKTVFEYEGNRVHDTSIGVRVKSISIADNNKTYKTRRFTYEEPYVDGPSAPVLQMYVTVSAPQDLNQSISQVWSTTLHETPVCIGLSVKDSKVYYRKVTETSADSKTEYKYKTDWIHLDGDNVLSRFPRTIEYNELNRDFTGFNPWLGVQDGYRGIGPSSSPLLVRKTEYKKNASGNWEKASSDSLTYVRELYDEVLVAYISTQVYNSTVGVTTPQPLDVYHYPVYAAVAPERKPVTKLHVEYHPSGNDSTLVRTAYLPRSSFDEPLRPQSVSFVEGGVRRKLEYTYPDTYGPQLRPLSQRIASGGPATIVMWYDLLADQHCLNVPLRTDYYVEAESDSLSTTPVRSEELTYGYFSIQIPPRLSKRILYPKEHKEYYLGNECWRETIQERDLHGNPTKVKEKGKPLTEIEWGYNGLYPVQIKQDSLVSTFTYRPGIGLTSSTSPSGIVTNYDYDHAGRLTAIRDGQGRVMHSWEYHLFNNGGDGLLHRRHRTYRIADGSEFGEDIRWWNTLGLTLQDQLVGGSGDGRNLITAYQADSLLHDDARIWLPYPVADTTFVYHPDAISQAIAFHGDSLAYYAKTYERSARDRVEREALPGFDGAHETVYSEDICQDGFPQLMWEDGSGIIQQGNYRPSEVVCRTITDADGRQKRTIVDHAGRTLATASGVDSLTWYVYDRYDNLRAVSGGGIAFSDTLSMWRYSYDSLGRMASKGIPGSVREFYTYDNEDRVIAVRRGEYLTETDYDVQGRPVRVYLTEGSSSRKLIEQHGYTADMETSASYAVLSPDSQEAGNICYAYEYDDRGRLTRSVAAYPQGDTLTVNTTFNFVGEVVSSSATSNASGQAYTLVLNSQLDRNGRQIAGVSRLKQGEITLKDVLSEYAYDAIGRPCGKTVTAPLTQYAITTEDELNLQGWLTQRLVKKNGVNYFGEILGYASYHTGLLKSRSSSWAFPGGRLSYPLPDIYTYDASGRLAEENTRSSVTSYTYDSRGNIVSEAINRNGTVSTINSSYNGDRLTSRGDKEFAHDEYGRMIEDWQSGIAFISYNALNLPQQMSLSDTVSFSFRYGAQGDKLDVLRTDGSGLVYRGPFVYMRSSDGALTLESAACPEGRLSSGAAMVYVTDYLGSVRAVLDASDGTVYEQSSYSVYGEGTHRTLSSLSGVTLRDHYTGCEDFTPEFGLPYTDHSARFYSSGLHRWLVPDPQSEKYYGVSPYTYCGGNPLGATDRNGEWFETLWDIANVASDVTSLVDNIASGNILGAVVDGVATTVDVAAAIIPFVPGGAGTALKAARTVDKVGDVAESVTTAKKVTPKKQTGSYTISFKSGFKYHGKGPESRMEQSAKQKSKEYSDKVVKKEWTPASSEKEAFMQEAKRIRKDKGVGPNHGNYNKINSPGEKMLQEVEKQQILQQKN